MNDQGNLPDYELRDKLFGHFVSALLGAAISFFASEFVRYADLAVKFEGWNT